MPMKYELRTVTPDHAGKLLELNTDNRTLTQSWVDTLAGAITRGEWLCTHQGIAISKDNVILDGQHRLWAIVQAGISVPLMVATNVDKETFALLDIGKKRTMHDILRYNKKDLETSTALFWLNDSKRTTPTPTQLSFVHEEFKNEIEELRNRCAINKAVFGSAVARAVCAVRAKMNLKDYAFNIYDGLNRNMPGGLPPIAQSFFKQVMDGRTKTDRAEIAARMWYVTDPARASNTRLQVVQTSDAIVVIRDNLRRIAPDVFNI